MVSFFSDAKRRKQLERPWKDLYKNVSKRDAKRVEKGYKMEPKWVQKSSKIDVKIEVGKKSEKRDAPARFRSVAGQ